MLIKTKKCSKCGKVKMIALFTKNKCSKDGRASYCNLCKAQKLRTYRLNSNSENNEGTKRQRDWLFQKKIGKDSYTGYTNFKKGVNDYV